jgi:hypothetical protein
MPLLLPLLLLAGACSNNRASRTAVAAATPRPTRTPAATETPTPISGSVQSVPSTSDLDGLSIHMGAPQYNIGDQARFCYTVPGTGSVTITNNGQSGTATLVTGRDDGTGGCSGGPIAGPAGKYCIVILFSGQAGVGTAQDCYQVFDAAHTS